MHAPLVFRHACAALLLALTGGFAAPVAHAAAPITGTVTDRTTGKVAAGDQVTLIQLQQGMQESTRTTTDARGHFSLDVPDDGIHLVRVTHDKANYFQPVQPGQQTVAVAVYDAAPSVAGVSTNVEELHVEATPTELHIVEVLQVLNESSPQRTQFGPKGFDFFLPKGALIGRTGAVTQGGMLVQSPAVPLGDPGHFAFLFPIRPGETQFGISYSLPYTGKYTFVPQLTTPVKALAVLLPSSMTLTPGVQSALRSDTAKPGTQAFLAQNVTPGQNLEFTVSGTGAMPDAPAAGDTSGAPNASTANPAGGAEGNVPAVSNSELAGGRGLNNPLDASGDRDPWAKYKWWILSGLALLLAGAAGILLRRPMGGASLAPAPVPQPSALPHASASVHGASVHATPAASLLSALKEELFVLETERLQRRITEPQYREIKGALELILGRALDRDTVRTNPPMHSEPSHGTAAVTLPEPELTGHKHA